MLYLKQSTASQIRLIGPFVDATDGNTAETGLTIANTDIRLSKNGGNMAAKNSGGGTHDEEGFYAITLDATDTATVGALQLSVQDAAHLPVYHEYTVLEEAVYDDLFAASAAGYAGITELATAQTDLDTITGADGANLLSATQASIDAIEADTNELQTDDVPGLIAALNDLSAAEVNTEVDTAFTTQMADSVPADGSIPTREQAILMITRFLWEKAVSGTTVTVTKEDGSTSNMTFTLDDGTNPTSITRAT